MDAKQPIDSLETLRLRIREFAVARAWERFHTPKNLAMALVVEAAELQEPFQWLTAGESAALSAETHEAVRQEIADVLIYAAADKLVINALKYPVDAAYGHARKSPRASGTTDSSDD